MVNNINFIAFDGDLKHKVKIEYVRINLTEVLVKSETEERFLARQKRFR